MHANSPRSHQQQASACFLIFTNMLSKWSLDSLICNSESQLNIFLSFLDIRTSPFENSMLTGLSPFLGWVLIFLVWYIRVCHLSLALIIIFCLLLAWSIIVNGTTRNLEPMILPHTSFSTLCTHEILPVLLLKEALNQLVSLPLQCPHHLSPYFCSSLSNCISSTIILSPSRS